MRRTDILEDLHRDNEKRIDKLEEPRIVLTTLRKWIIGLGGVAGAAIAIAKLFGMF